MDGTPQQECLLDIIMQSFLVTFRKKRNKTVMKYLFTLFTLFTATLTFAQNSAGDTTISNPNYDESLAKKLGGDEYGMKMYILVILKTGTNTNADKELISESFSGHMDNINRLVEAGKLIVAGPLGKNERSYRGIFILNNVSSIEEANEILQTDPAIKNKLLDVEIFHWYGSAALPEYLPFSDKIWKSNH
jgi:uncharacterized protein YciI